MIIAILSGATLFNVYNESTTAARDTATDLFSLTTDRVVERIESVLDQSLFLTQTFADLPAMQEPLPPGNAPHRITEAFRIILSGREWFYSIYFGLSNGGFLQVIAARGNQVTLAQHDAPDGTHYIVRKIVNEAGGERIEHRRFLDDAGNLIGEPTTLRADYDPRERPWYREAIASPRSVITDPYAFGSLKAYGISIAKRIRGERGVVGIDFTFDSLNAFLDQQVVSENGSVVLFDRFSKLIAFAGKAPPGAFLQAGANMMESPSALLQAIAPLRVADQLDRAHFKDIEGEPSLLFVEQILPEISGSLYAATAGPMSDFTGHIEAMQLKILIVALVLILVVAPITYYVIGRLSQALTTLGRESEAIQQFSFTDTPVVHSLFREVDQLGSAFAMMKSTIRDRTASLEDTQDKLEALVKDSLALSAERGLHRLYAIFLEGARELSLSPGAILLIQDGDRFYTRSAAFDTRNFDVAVVAGKEGYPDLTVGDEDQDTLADLSRGTRHFDLVDDADTPPTVTRLVERLDAWADYRTRHVLVAPLRENSGDIHGLVILMHGAPVGEIDDDEVEPFSDELRGFVETLSAQIANMGALKRHEIYLEEMVERRTQELNAALEVIQGSVEYASYIQRSLLPSPADMADAFPDHFALWQPRDVVGGDFYWLEPVDKGELMIVCDCTGHGVPGAFMTILSTGMLHRTLVEQRDGDPAALLASMNRLVKEALSQDTEDGYADDGLELGVCRIEDGGRRMTYAGARFTLLIRGTDGDIEEIKGDKTGIGYRRVDPNFAFTNHTIDVRPGTTFCLHSDGITDQVGGPKRRAFGRKRLLQLLTAHHDKPFAEQQAAIEAAFADYRGDEAPRDDVTVVAFKPLA